MAKDDFPKGMTARDKALVSIAVLLDGREGATYLQNDAKKGNDLRDAALRLADYSADLRIPYVGTLFRRALEEISKNG